MSAKLWLFQASRNKWFKLPWMAWTSACGAATCQLQLAWCRCRKSLTQEGSDCIHLTLRPLHIRPKLQILAQHRESSLLVVRFGWAHRPAAATTPQASSPSQHVPSLPASFPPGWRQTHAKHCVDTASILGYYRVPEDHISIGIRHSGSKAHTGGASGNHCV